MTAETTTSLLPELISKLIYHTTTLFIILFAYFITNVVMFIPAFYEHFFGKFDLYHVGPIAYYLTASNFIFLVVPLLLGKYALSIKPKDMGFVIPAINRANIFIFISAYLLLMPFLYVFFHSSSLQAFYRYPDINTLTFICINLVALHIYYFGEEFFFRGFLFLTLWERIGWHSFWITDLLFTYSHLSKPVLEVLFCIPATIILNYLVSRSRSFYPPFIAHLSIGITINVASWLL